PTLSTYAQHRHPHSFPTRRSSDLELIDNGETELLKEPTKSLIFHLVHVVIGRVGDIPIRRRHEEDRREARPLGSHVNEMKNEALDRKSTRLNSSHVKISYAVFCLK